MNGFILMNKSIRENIFSLLLLLFSITIFLLIFYRSEIFWDGENRSYYLKYYIFSILLIFISILTFYLNKQIKIYFFIFFSSVLLTLYLFEGFLTLKVIKINNKNKELYGINFENRSRLQIYEDLKEKNKNVSVTVSPSIYLDKKEINLFPLSGKSNSLTIFCNENGYYSIFESDRYGFNNPDNEWSSSELEYLIIGDSFAQGACVNRPYDIGSQLRNLSKKNVLNLGYGGNGPLIEYASLKEYFPNNVKNVIWLYMNGDMINLESEIKNKILIQYLKQDDFSQVLKKKQDLIDQIVEKNIIEENSKAKNKIKFSLIKNFIKLYNLRMNFFHSNPKESPKLHKNFKEIILKSKNFSNDLGSNFYFVYLPEYSRYKLRKNYDNSNYEDVKKIMKELNIKFIDIHSGVFQKEKDPLKLFPFGLNGHYNIEGFQKISEFIFSETQ